MADGCHLTVIVRPDSPGNPVNSAFASFAAAIVGVARCRRVRIGRRLGVAFPHAQVAGARD